MTKHFKKWSRKRRVLAGQLLAAADELDSGIIDACLGPFLFKKRLKINNRGKRAAARTILFYIKGDKLIYLYGYMKNEKEELTAAEYKAIRTIADAFERVNNDDIKRGIKIGELFEVSDE